MKRRSRSSRPSSRGCPPHDRQQDHAERFLHLRVLEKVGQNDLRLFVALHLDHDAHAIAVAFVADVGDAFDFLVLDQLGDVLDQARFVDLIGQLGDDDVLPFLAALLDGGFGAHLERSAAVGIGLLDSFAAVDVAAGGKVRTGDELHHFFQVGVRLFDQQDRGFHNFFQIVRRDVRRHADRNAGRAVDEKIGNARWENDRFLLALIEVGSEIDGFLLDIREHFLSDLRKARLGIPHGRGRVAIHRAEVSLAVDERVAHVEILRHAYKGVIHGRVAVRMEFAEDFADDLRALAVGFRRGESQLVHAEENPPVDGLQAVTHVRQGAPDDYAHRVIEVRLLHFRFDIDRRQYLLV